MKVYLIRAIRGKSGPNAFFDASRTPSPQAISLKGVVILNVLCELREGISCSGALCTTEEGHLEDSRCIQT